MHFLEKSTLPLFLPPAKAVSPPRLANPWVTKKSPRAIPLRGGLAGAWLERPPPDWRQLAMAEPIRCLRKD